MDAQFVTLFLFGIFGAILFILIAKQQLIPEFRPLYDVENMLTELTELNNRIETAEKQRDSLQEERNTVDPNRAEIYKATVTSVENEINSFRQRRTELERQVRKNQIFVRLAGFFCYIILGGIFAAILSNSISIEGINEELSIYLKPMAIGATWTSLLSTMGFNFGRSEADSQIKLIERNVTQKIDTLKRDVSESVSQAMKTAELSPQKNEPEMAFKVTHDIEQKIAAASNDIQQQITRTQNVIQRHFR